MDKNIYSHELLAQLWKTVKSGKRKSQTHRGRPPGVAEDGGGLGYGEMIEKVKFRFVSYKENEWKEWFLLDW